MIAVAGLTHAHAQSVADYNTVLIPQNFSEFKGNQYNLRKVLISKLQAKNFRIIEEGTDVISSDENPCNMLKADVENTSGMLKNKVTVHLKDCRGADIYKSEGSSLEKDFDKGYPEALINAVKNLPASNGKSLGAIPVIVQDEKKELPKTDNKLQEKTPGKTSEKSAVYNEKTKSQPLVFRNGNMQYQRVNLGKGQFIFTTTGSSVPYATFKETFKPGVYRVQLENGTQTIAYDEGENIIIEVPQNDGNFRREEFNP